MATRRVTLVLVIVAALATAACGGMPPPLVSTAVPASASPVAAVPSPTTTRAPTAAPTTPPTTAPTTAPTATPPIEAVLVDLPTGDCALEVRHVHVPNDKRHEVATVLDPRPSGAAFQVDRDHLLNGTWVAWVSAAGDGWSGWNYRVETGPNGFKTKSYSEPRNQAHYFHGAINDFNVIWMQALSEVGRHIVHLSGEGQKCDATLVFEVS